MKSKKQLALACPIDAIEATVCPMAAFSGFYESPGPPPWVDVRGIVPPHRDDHQMAIKVSTFCIVVLFAVTLVAAGVIHSQYLPDGGIQWLLLKPWSYCIGRCAPYRFNVSSRPSKWPATEVHSFAAAAYFN